MLKRVLTAAFVASLASAIAHGQQRAPAGDLKIVVIAGEGAVNIIQQKTAVAPIIEVRDRNNLPVSGVSVTFSVSGSGATFGSGSTLTAITNAAGQATAAGLTPTAAGAVQVNVTAAFQGQMATAAITHTDAWVDWRAVVLHTYVDYKWELNAAVQNVHAFHPRVAAISGAALQVLGVDGTRGRGTQTGARGEGGVRFRGRAGAVELFVAGERRVDPYPLDFGVDTWFIAGFRFLSR